MRTFHLRQLPRFQRASWFPREFLDARDRRAYVWSALGVGAGLGLAWGIAARVWMRLISINPELTASGTTFILLVSTVFGTCTGLAYVARKRGSARWARYLCRGLVVLTFLPFGFAGGAPLMLTVLSATVGFTQTAWPRFVRAIPLLLALAGVVFVSWEIVNDKPGMLAALYVLLYLVLLYPLCLGLSTGLHPIRQTAPNDSKAEALVLVGEAT
jgi:hypothetical protein